MVQFIQNRPDYVALDTLCLGSGYRSRNLVKYFEVVNSTLLTRENVLQPGIAADPHVALGHSGFEDIRVMNMA